MEENIIKNGHIVNVEFGDNEFALCETDCVDLIMCKTICGGDGTFIVDEIEEIHWSAWSSVSLASKVTKLENNPNTLSSIILYYTHMNVLPCGLLLDDKNAILSGISAVIENDYQDWNDVYCGIVSSEKSVVYKIDWDEVDDIFHDAPLSESINETIVTCVTDILYTHEEWFDSLDQLEIKYDINDIVDSISTDKFKLIKYNDLTDEEYNELCHLNSDRECYELIYIPKGCKYPIRICTHSENPEPIHWLKGLWYMMKETN